MKPLRSILASLALVILATPAWAVQVPVSADTTGSAVTNKIAKSAGTLPNLTISSKSTAFLSFDLSSTGLTSSQVADARLILYYSKVTKPGNIAFHVNSAAFQEKFTVASIASPAFGPAGGPILVTAAQTKSYVELGGLKELVQSWLDDPSTNFGFAVTGDATVNVMLASKETSIGVSAVLEIETSNLTSISEDQSGNVGIGNGTPVKPLDVGLNAGTVKAGTDSVDGSLSLRLTNLTQTGNATNPNVVGIGFGALTDTRQAIVGGTFGSDFLEFFTNGDMTHPKMTIDANGAVIIPGSFINTGAATFTGGLTVNGPSTFNGTPTFGAGAQIAAGQLAIGPFAADATETITQVAALTLNTSSTYSFEVNGTPGLGIGNLGLGVDAAGAHLTTFGQFVPTPPFNATLPLFINDNGGNTILNPSGGSVGIGTSGPGAKLDVRGDIKLGPSGQFQATSGEEKLRIVRGVVVGTTVGAGTGFTVTHPSTGKYTVTFTTAFANTPVVTVNALTQTPVRIASVSANNTNSIDLSFKTSDNVDNDTGGFEFIVIGPR